MTASVRTQRRAIRTKPAKTPEPRACCGPGMEGPAKLRRLVARATDPKRKCNVNIRNKRLRVY